MGKKFELDVEWVALIQEALDAGISSKQIAEYLQGTISHTEVEIERVHVG